VPVLRDLTINNYQTQVMAVVRDLTINNNKQINQQIFLCGRSEPWTAVVRSHVTVYVSRFVLPMRIQSIV